MKEIEAKIEILGYPLTQSSQMAGFLFISLLKNHKVILMKADSLNLFQRTLSSNISFLDITNFRVLYVFPFNDKLR